MSDDERDDHEILRRSFEVPDVDEPVVRCTDALHALAELLAERDRLRAELDERTLQKAILAGTRAQEEARADDAEAERDRLRAVVEDAVAVLGGEDNDYDEWCALLGRLRAALDVSGITGGQHPEFCNPGCPPSCPGRGCQPVPVPERERIVHENAELRESLEQRPSAADIAQRHGHPKAPGAQEEVDLITGRPMGPPEGWEPDESPAGGAGDE